MRVSALQVEAGVPGEQLHRDANTERSQPGLWIQTQDIHAVRQVCHPLWCLLYTGWPLYENMARGSLVTTITIVITVFNLLQWYYTVETVAPLFLKGKFIKIIQINIINFSKTSCCKHAPSSCCHGQQQRCSQNETETLTVCAVRAAPSVRHVWIQCPWIPKSGSWCEMCEIKS